MARFSLFALVLTLVASATATLRASMQFYGSDGLSTLKDTPQFKGQISIQNYSFNIQTALSIGSGSGGAGAGKTSFNNFSFTRPVDGNSPGFFQNQVQGVPYSKAVLTLTNEQSGQVAITYTFSTVFVNSQTISGGNGDAPAETVTFDYGDLSMAEVTSAGQNIQFCWTRIKNMQC